MNTYKLQKGEFFSPFKTFDCGQCFRFADKGEYIEGVVGKSLVRFYKDEGNEIKYTSSGDFDIESFVDGRNSYADMSADFIGRFEGEEKNAILSAYDMSKGIRILKQDFFEALISFIISQNNNIPRIKKNVAEISKRYGKPFEVEGETYYSFPTARALLEAGEEGLSDCRLGFRVKYILDAAEKVNSGEITEKALLQMNDDEAVEYLKKIKGVGLKVASCTLLFGEGRIGFVPVDVWMKKVFEKYFGGRVPDFGPYGGLCQQYLFYSERYIVEGK